MKKVIRHSILVLLVVTGCSKDPIFCEGGTELTDRHHLVDIRALQAAPELLDSLEKHPQLRVTSIINDKYAIGMHCDVFYEGLIIFTDHYSLFKSKSENIILGGNTLPVELNISLIPSIGPQEAIRIAKGKLNFDHTCIVYRLGIYDINAGQSFQPKNYTLAWKIEGGNGYEVILDANSGKSYSAFNGIRE